MSLLHKSCYIYTKVKKQRNTSPWFVLVDLQCEDQMLLPIIPCVVWKDDVWISEWIIGGHQLKVQTGTTFPTIKEPGWHPLKGRPDSDRNWFGLLVPVKCCRSNIYMYICVCVTQKHFVHLIRVALKKVLKTFVLALHTRTRAHTHRVHCFKQNTCSLAHTHTLVTHSKRVHELVRGSTHIWHILNTKDDVVIDQFLCYKHHNSHVLFTFSLL